MTNVFAEAERVAAAIGPLRLTRARSAAARAAGRHPRRISGPGHEFWQYRELAPGESAERVDWRRSARSDNYFVREREREDPVRLWLWVDQSASMRFSSGHAPGKLDVALIVAGAIAISAHEAGETCRIAGMPTPIRPQELFVDRAFPVPDTASLGPADVIIAVGDFLDAGSLDWVDEASRAGASGVVVAVQDRAEIEFPFDGRVRFDAVEDDETPVEVGRAETLREQYLAAWAAHRARLAEIGNRPGWLAVEVPTDEDIAGHAGSIADWLGTPD